MLGCEGATDIKNPRVPQICRTDIKNTLCRIDLGNPDLSHTKKYEPASWRCVLRKATAFETAPRVPIGAEVRPSSDVRIITLWRCVSQFV